MSRSSSSAPAGTHDRWADPASRRRGLFNMMTSSAVLFGIPGVVAGSVVAVILRRTRPAGHQPPPHHPDRGATVGAAAGGLVGALFGVALAAVFAVFDTAIRRHIAVQRSSDRPSELQQSADPGTHVSG